MYHSRIEQFFLIWRLFSYCSIAASDGSQCSSSSGCPPPATLTCTCPPPCTEESDCPPPGTLTCTCPVCPGQSDGDACESSPCQNGGTCISEDDGFTCQCSEEYTGERCESVVSCEFFAMSRTGQGKFLSSTGEVTSVDLLSDLAMRVANDGTGKLFYTTAEGNSVYVYDMSYPVVQQAEVALFDDKTYGIAVDPLLKVVFVGVTNFGIQRINYDGGDQATVAAITNTLSNIDGLALDLDTRDLFFSEYQSNRVGKVNYQDLNNPGDVVIIKSGFSSKPVTFFSDKPAQRLYILLDNGAIWSLNLLDHTDLGPIVSAPSDETRGAALRVCGADIYYTDFKIDTVWRIPKSESDGDEREQFNLSGVGTLRGMTLI